MSDAGTSLILSAPSFTTENELGRRSCEFSTRPSYCIAKTSINLKKLETCLLDFKQKVKKKESELIENTETRLFRFAGHTVANNSITKLEPIQSGTALEVFHEDGGTRNQQEIDDEDNDENSTRDIILQKERLFELPKNQLVMLSHVKYLLERLDESCIKTKELLYKEQERTASLRETIDRHAYRRIHELPKKVQHEHEKCAYDIQELKWHCAYQGRAEARLREKVRVAENINRRIIEEIEFVKESSPLISEKQKQEKESMVKIQAKQDDTDEKLKNAREKLEKIERDFERAKRQADHEENNLGERLLSLSNELKIAQEKFLEAQNVHNTMIETIMKIDKKLTEGEDKDRELQNSLVKIKTRQRNLKSEVESLESRIDRESGEYEQLVNQNTKLTKTKNDQEENVDKMRKEYELLIQSKTKELQRILKCNKSSQKEISNLKRRIDASEKQKIADIKSVKRALEEREKVMAELEVIKEETEENRGVHNKLLVTLEQEREKAIEIEENLSLQVDGLKKSNKEENYARVILQARINAESADLIKRREEAELKKEKLLKARKDVNLVVTTVNAQVTKLEEKYKERLDALDALNKLIDQLSEKHQQMETNWNNKIKQLEPKELELKDSISNLNEKENEMEATTAVLNKKLGDMSSSSIMMNKLLLANQNAIDELNDEIDELQIQLDSGQGLETALRESLQKVEERSLDNSKRHIFQKQCRTETLHILKEQVDLALQMNREVAMVYIKLQNNHIDQKNQFLSVYEKSLIAHDSLVDKENLCELHTRLHEAMKCYYQLRGIQTKAGLSRFDQMTHASNKKLENVQKSLEVATSNITAFLKANNTTHGHIQQMVKQIST